MGAESQEASRTILVPLYCSPSQLAGPAVKGLPGLVCVWKVLTGVQHKPSEHLCLPRYSALLGTGRLGEEKGPDLQSSG